MVDPIVGKNSFQFHSLVSGETKNSINYYEVLGQGNDQGYKDKTEDLSMKWMF